MLKELHTEVIESVAMGGLEVREDIWRAGLEYLQGDTDKNWRQAVMCLEALKAEMARPTDLDHEETQQKSRILGIIEFDIQEILNHHLGANQGRFWRKILALMPIPSH